MASVLSNRDILTEMKDGGNVVIEPYNPDQLSNSSYDCTLGPYYYDENLDNNEPFFCPWNEEMVERYWSEHYKTAEEVVSPKLALRYGCQTGDRVIIVRPGRTILAHTNEFIGGRNNITTMMKARSSLGRCCVSVCKCAGWGDIGYINRWTMEIQNTGRANLVLIVGQKMCQIVFFRTGSCFANTSYEVRGSYQLSSDINTIIQAWTPEMMKPHLRRTIPVEKHVSKVVRIHRIDESHIRGISELQHRLFVAPYVYDYQTLTEICSSGNGYVAILEDEKLTCVGFILYRTVPHMITQKPVSTILSLGVDPAYQHQGIGTFLLKSTVADSNPWYLEVKCENQIAIHLYEKLGFQAIAKLEQHYIDTTPPTDGYYMERKG